MRYKIFFYVMLALFFDFHEFTGLEIYQYGRFYFGNYLKKNKN